MPEAREYDLDRLRELARTGAHRFAVGALWDDIGSLTFEFLVDRGLRPEMTVLDVGCGSLRVGLPLVRYLNAGGYFGVDAVSELLDAGYEIELDQAGLQHKLPRSHLSATQTFDFTTLPIGRPVDVAIAQSLFSHLSLNNLRLCLANLAHVMAEGGMFYATIFHCPDDSDWRLPIHHPAGSITYAASDPYHYRTSDITYAISGLPWTFDAPVLWGHPRDQSMIVFQRTVDR